jgi:iron complex outermembrane receptor protein
MPQRGFMAKITRHTMRNSYGNESANRRTLSLGEKLRGGPNGILRKELLIISIQNLKGDVALHYAFTPDTRIAYTYRVAT